MKFEKPVVIVDKFELTDTIAASSEPAVVDNPLNNYVDGVWQNC